MAFNPEERMAVVAEYLLKYPFHYVLPVIIGRPMRGGWSETASATLISFRDGVKEVKCAVTAQHVLEIYRREHAKDKRVVFQIGSHTLPVEDIVRSESRDHDLVILEGESIEFEPERDDELPRMQFLSTASWPPGPEVAEHDTVFFGGFLGVDVTIEEDGRRGVWDTYGLACTEVTEAYNDRFYMTLDRSGWTINTGDQRRKMEKDLSGLSGCGVFRDRGRHGALAPELVGFIMGYDRDRDKLIVTSAGNIRSTGYVTSRPRG